MDEIINPAAEPLKRLRRDVKTAAATLTRREARYLVDLYYQMQDYRMAASKQGGDLGKVGEPHTAIDWFAGQMDTLESQVRNVLGAFSEASELGRWARSVVGIGPVISAGLLAWIDIEKAQSVSAVWRFAGLDPSVRWTGREDSAKWVSANVETPDTFAIARAAQDFGRNAESFLSSCQTDPRGKARKVTHAVLATALARRPWNASLKTLTWKIGESFVKVQNSDGAVYGQFFASRKAEEWSRNLSGRNVESAAGALARKKYGDDTRAKLWYTGAFSPEDVRAELAKDSPDWMGMKLSETGGVPMLPPAHVHARARRATVKLFLSHYWQRGREFAGLPVPPPYAIAHQGHAHVIEPD